MIFNSLTFLVFLTVFVVVYWMLPQRLRTGWIFSASIVFYGFWRIEFIPLMLVSATVDYFAALAIFRSQDTVKRRALLLVSLAINLGLLFYFKYLYFFAETAAGAAGFFGYQYEVPPLNIILPLGISFYTFQTISYTIDVYRGVMQPEKRYFVYGSYVTFFPQLVAGPILRAKEVIPQLTSRLDFDWANIEAGLRRICYGLFLKVALADNIAPIVDSGFAQPVENLGAIDVLTLSFLFGFQIYFDFSAYSHIAIGSARLLGIHFPENFNFPYMSRSPKEFWQRWHISLSSWIRDYLYLPLTGVKVVSRSTGGLATAANSEGTETRTRALLITWLLMGLWHGANWTFVLWGLYHAMLVLAYRLIRGHFDWLPDSIRAGAGWIMVLLFSMIGWIPFRAESVTDAIRMMAKLVQPSEYAGLGLRENDYLVAASILLCHVMVYIYKARISPMMAPRGPQKKIVESISFAFQISIIFVFLRPIKQFIYFQF